MYYSHWFIQLCVPDLRHINFLMQKSCLLSIPSHTQTSSLSIMNRIHHMYSSFIPIIRCFLVLWKPLLILFCVVSWLLFLLYWAIWWSYPTTTPRNNPQIKLFFFTWRTYQKATMLPSQAQSALVLELMVLGFIAVFLMDHWFLSITCACTKFRLPMYICTYYANSVKQSLQLPMRILMFLVNSTRQKLILRCLYSYTKCSCTVMKKI